MTAGVIKEGIWVLFQIGPVYITSIGFSADELENFYALIRSQGVKDTDEEDEDEEDTDLSGVNADAAFAGTSVWT
ncbi:hypothetical protein N7519_004665 [Penicillium mononematosum]|uniref:uncharacterized protein n=1 Tax=Penicillium mononematosum TaxID=268346 RepID=UPI0025488CB9|nr:uncharacterized protein N7519_004665 [Penicillium mononematosum]KAJ6189757.1 hypothetical protein N7519_004665 [Penicillium mononematosum]